MTTRDPASDGRSCDLCGGKKFSFLHGWEVGDRWNTATIPIAVWKCECGLVILHPVPTPAQMPDQGEWWSNKRVKFQRNPRFKHLRRKFTRFFIGDPKYRLVKDTRQAVRSGRWLDVGCGDGKLLGRAAPFYECVGLEPSPIAAAEVRAKGFQVIESTLEDARIEPQSFDVVLLDSVIEHVTSPRQILTIVNRVLRPGGVAVLKTPKFGGPAYRRHQSGWNGFRHGYHTYLFSGETLGRYLQQTGFEVLKHPKRDRALDDVLILWGRKVSEATAQSLSDWSPSGQR